MRHLRTILFVSVLAIASAGVVRAGVVKHISFVFDRTNGYQSLVTIKGDSIDVAGQFRSLTAPVICAPCTANTPIIFGPAFDDSGIVEVSGTIDGTFYPTLFVQHSLRYQGGPVSIPRVWSKSPRVHAPITLTGGLGMWGNLADVGIRDRALFIEDELALHGNADLRLRWTVDSLRRYSDRYLSFDLSDQE